MQKLVKNYLDEFNKRHKRNRRAIVALLLMAVLVVGGVLGTLSQYGVALEEPEKKSLCGLEEHTHTEECYQDVLICGYGEGAETKAEAGPKQEQAAQEPAVQEQVEKVLSCGQEEQEGHQHSKSCYETRSELTCGQEESEGHTHTEACYGEDGELTCELAESEGHTHSDGCHTEEEVLVCGKEEGEGAHTHTEACYTETVSMVPAETTPAGQESSENSEEAAETHTHTEACYERRLVCGLEEHTHTEACYIDGVADVEAASDWEEMFADVEWKEQWGEDLVTAAQMQIGYQESQANYQSEEDGTHKGYTRYGAFMDDPYMDWNAAFVNFCLYYAGLNEEDVFPEETNAGEWYKTFVEADENNADYITLPEEYEPKAGDIVFLEDEENEETLMGIVSSYDEETGEAKVIAGDDGDEVTEETYVVKGEATDESPINSYLMTTELEDHIKNNTRIMKAEGEDYTVTVRFTDAAEIPDDAELNVREIEEGTDEYEEHYEQSLEAMEAEELSFARYFDITFLVNGEKIEPKDMVNVTINCADSIEAGENDKLGVVHFKNDGEIEVLDVESNLNGGTATTLDKEAGSDPEEETTGTFFRFEQNSFSVDGITVALEGATPTALDLKETYDFYKCEISNIDEDLVGKVFLITNLIENGTSRIMTGEVKDSNKINAESISKDATVISRNLNYAWTLKKVGDRYYLYNIGKKRYLRMYSNSTNLTLVTEMSGGTYNNSWDAYITLEHLNDGTIGIKRGDFRLNNSGSGSDAKFIGWNSGSIASNEKLTIFKLQKTVAVLNPYNISNAGTKNSPYRFIVDKQGGEKPIRLPLSTGEDITVENLENGVTGTETEKIILPNDVTRKEGFDISLPSEGKGSHTIGDSETGYKWKLKGWYNIADGSYYSVGDTTKTEVPLVKNKANVFYADWEAAAYDNGKEQSGLVETADTSGFVKTELFDYNELVNITLNKADGTFGKKLDEDKATAEGECWVEASGKGVMFGNWVLQGDNNDGLGNLGSSYKTDGTSDLSSEITNRDNVDKIISTLFDFETLPMGVTSVGTAEGLYKKDSNGYYEYNSDSNAASYSQGKFYVYGKPQKIGEKTAFLPFNGEDNYSQSDGTVNYWFGMKTEINYWLNDNSGSAGNNCINGESMVFEFTGDDDVWVFDETPGGKKELLLNLSSCHGPWSGTIDFSTGKVTKAKSETITGSNAVIEDFHEQLKSGQHKLTVYYLERGAGDSNCKIKFNLVSAWEYSGKPLQKITVNKKWEDATPSNANVSVSLFESDAKGNKISEVKETQELSADNNWTYTWYKPMGTGYTVEEAESDSYIMVKSERILNYWNSWIENSNLSGDDRIVIGNGKGGDDGRVLEVNAENIGIAVRGAFVLKGKDGKLTCGQAESETHTHTDACYEESDVLRNEDTIERGIPLSQQWIVHEVKPKTDNEEDSQFQKYSQFQLESASKRGFYLSIRDAKKGLQLLNEGSENISTFYFNGGQLTGTSSNQLVWDGSNFVVVEKKVDDTSDTTRSADDNRVHLYKYFPAGTEVSPLTNVTITNKPLTANLRIKKVDRAAENGLGINGATFQLYLMKTDEDGTVSETLYPDETNPLVITTEGDGDNLGTAVINHPLPVGTYHLKETIAPEGYALLADPIVITVSKEGTGTEARAKVEVNFNNAWADGNEGFETVDGETGHLTYADGTFTIEVPNVLLYELPSTGGIGTYWYTIGGTLLLMAAALVLYKRKYAGRY